MSDDLCAEALAKDQAWAESEAALGELRVKKTASIYAPAVRISLPILWAVTLLVLARFVLLSTASQSSLQNVAYLHNKFSSAFPKKQPGTARYKTGPKTVTHLPPDFVKPRFTPLSRFYIL